MSPVATLDPAPAVVRDVASEVASLAGVLNTVMARLVEVTAAAIAAGETDEAGMRTPAAWLAWRSGLSPEHAGQVVRLAKVRDRYPLLFDAFEQGVVSADQMTELVKAPEWAQSQVLGFAEIGTVTRLRRAIRDEAFEHDPDEPADEKRARAPQNRVSFGIRDGRWKLTGDLDLDLGKRVEAAFTEAKDRLFDDGNPDASWSDALVDVAERSLDQVPSRDRRDRYRTWFHHDTGSGATNTTDGWRIPQNLARLCSCDGLGAVVYHHDGLPVSVGRTQYIVPDRTRRVVERRDRGCRVPGCTAERFVEIHHIVHWEDGGPTDTWNLLCLCARHHRMHHKGELGIAGNADRADGIEFTDARGRPIPHSHPPEPPPGGIPDCERPYQAPPAGRVNYDWVGLGWAHPNALKRRRDQANRLQRD
ncbi:MAG: DUF222 domain-containing protein [Ilumatobacteraceae bacterium]